MAPKTFCPGTHYQHFIILNSERCFFLISILTVLAKIPVNYILSHSQWTSSFPSSLNSALTAVIISYLVLLFSIKLVCLVFPQSSKKTKQKNCVEDRACNIPVKHALKSHIPLSAHICHQPLVLRKTASSHSDIFQNISPNC